MLDKNRKERKMPQHGSTARSGSGRKRNLAETTPSNRRTAGAMADQAVMSNSITKQNLRQTGQADIQTAYSVMNRNGMINSVDPVNQNLRLNEPDENAGSSPVIQTGGTSAKHLDATQKPARAHRPHKDN
ncbi:hypothetical protein [Ethanoligenens harbinense]|uniref:Uncharacterized protein n=1 Tax=Ethanoligenens harbinense (strain DSM 18485 / JCM 12961 / CGMCC 1.5033 / YUAN-3) TaxID=663278 RepID=E6U4G4_ETHHY|nr:hypothetical protein [Ethanoligenens harbinense]ADU27771.1 hypothetical protein Ethha_2257 [Ethanoligenens harbinense YUAN-3]AVQ96794.1 hypothetical protein CXQ68_11610 [Ethanoligenens harbinense YUAN-3]AYF39456.1 hypothetical protein CXP51_11505 [Ethanoligenens harbinense]AYF42280.1 hypothetical protein CN246_12050 [Ethanoligenens harbinense]QCN93035.1 hypothetical protein DRA42_11645 [Ethanoligenens harbinense]